MAEASQRDRLQHLMQSHPHLAETLAYLASVDMSAKTMGGGAEPRQRWDHELICQLIPSGATVLDVGCGSGELLQQLIRDNGCVGQGIERDAESVMLCVERGVPVIQMDVDDGLHGFSTRGFDYVVLEETLQTVVRPEVVLHEMLRVGRVGIVSFPNFGHWWVRTQLLIEGRMPMTAKLPFTWYGTPNIHVLTVRDFEAWCESNDVTIHACYAYAEGQYDKLIPADNVLAEEALFVIGRE